MLVQVSKKKHSVSKHIIIKYPVFVFFSPLLGLVYGNELKKIVQSTKYNSK